jgi:hypothetical protein
MIEQLHPPTLFCRQWFLPGVFALIKILIHLPFLGRYGYHHDELYFLDCGYHFAFGYVDHAPVVPWIARLADALFGQSLVGLRSFSLLAGAGVVFLTGLLVLRLGGGKFGVFAACFSLFIAPIFVRPNIIFCIPAFESIIWISCAYLLVRIIQENTLRLWIWIGVLIGAGLMIKHSTLLLVFGLGVGVLLTPLRNHLRTRWPYIAAAIALCIFLPNILWQIDNGWPTVEFLRNLNKGTMSGISVLQFVLGQFMYLNPITAPLWIGGLVYFFAKAGKPYRIFGWIYLSLFILLLFIKSKIYYLAPAYPAVLAGGGVALDHLIIRRNLPRLKPIIASVMILALILFAPILLPITSMSTMDRYCKAMTFGSFENVYEITGDLHGQFAWKERVELVAKAYNSLPPQQRDSTAIFGSWYGVTGAINYFGGEYGLPKAISGHMTYFLWGPPRKPITIVLVTDPRPDELKKIFNTVTLVGPAILEDVNPWERQFSVAICRGPKFDINKDWARVKRW